MSDIRIDSSELRNSRVDEVIETEAALRGRPTEDFAEDVATPLIHNPILHYSVAGSVMAFAAWAVIEPSFDDFDPTPSPLSGFMLFMLTAAFVGLGLGTVYGLANRNPRQSLYCGAVGFGVGLVAGIALTILAGLAFGVGSAVAFEVNGADTIDSVADISPLAFFMLVCTRSLAWALAAPAAGLSLGIALKSKKLLSVGVIGAIVGGAMGGLFFDPVDRLMNPDSTDQAWLSRMVGLTSVGLFVGLFTGYFENLSRTAWLQMLQGPLTGKQFNIYKSTMTIGSAPNADVYLFKDAGIGSEHATITTVGAKYLLTDLQSNTGVYVNGTRVQKKMLEKGDVVQLGDTVLKYDERG